MSERIKQALCCVCGTVRVCRRPRNYRRENYWLRGPVDRDWHRETGELKCAECGRITTHAIITGDNHAESIRKAATGWKYKALDEAGHERVRQVWREGLPRNPYMRHLWRISDENNARDAGQSHFAAICNTLIPLPKRAAEDGDVSYGGDELVAPDRFHDVDREDPETGLWWFDVDCVDCLNWANACALEHQRKALKARMQEIVDKIDHLPAPTVAELLANFDEVKGCDA